MLNALVPVAPEQQRAAKKRGVKANCANVQKAREVTAQRRAAEAAGPIEVGAQAGGAAASSHPDVDTAASQLTVRAQGPTGYQQQPPPPRPFSMLSHKVGKPTSR
ncbi:hypothetical protein HaLaN_18558, partial [Haematococcus lacustris]